MTTYLTDPTSNRAVAMTSPSTRNWAAQIMPNTASVAALHSVLANPAGGLSPDERAELDHHVASFQPYTRMGSDGRNQLHLGVDSIEQKPWLSSLARAKELNSRLPADQQMSLPVVVGDASRAAAKIGRLVSKPTATQKIAGLLPIEQRQRLVQQRSIAQGLRDRGMDPETAMLHAAVQMGGPEGENAKAMLNPALAQSQAAQQLAQQQFAHQQTMDKRTADREDQMAKWKASPGGGALAAYMADPGAVGIHGLMALHQLLSGQQAGQSAAGAVQPGVSVVNTGGPQPWMYEPGSDEHKAATAAQLSHTNPTAEPVLNQLHAIYKRTNLGGHWMMPNMLAVNSPEALQRFVEAAKGNGLSEASALKWWDSNFGLPRESAVEPAGSRDFR